MNPLYYRHQSSDRPGAQWRNPRGVVAALLVGAAMWVCGCGAAYALYRILAH